MSYKESYGHHGKSFKYDFSLSKNPYGCSPKVGEKISAALGGISLYPSSEQTLVDLIAERENVPPECVFVTAGSLQAIDTIADMCLDVPGKTAIVPELTFEEFIYSAARKKPNVVLSPMTKDLAIDIDDIVSKIKTGDELVYIVNPNNPTGLSLNSDFVGRISKALNKGGFLIVDEANIEFNPGCASALKFVHEFDNVFVTRTFSKAYGLAALRIGYFYAPPKMVDHLRTYYPIYRCSELSILGAIEALKDQDFLKGCIEKVRKTYDCFTTQLDELGMSYIPSSVHTVLINRPAQFDTVDAFVAFLNERDISVVSSPKSDSIRIALSTPEEIQKLIEAFKELS